MSKELIIGQAEKTYVIMANGQITAFKSKMDYEEVYTWVLDGIKAGFLELIVKDTIRSYMIISEYQHFSFILMTESDYSRWQIEQRLAAGQGIGRG